MDPAHFFTVVCTGTLKWFSTGSFQLRQKIIFCRWVKISHNFITTHYFWTNLRLQGFCDLLQHQKKFWVKWTISWTIREQSWQDCSRVGQIPHLPHRSHMTSTGHMWPVTCDRLLVTYDRYWSHVTGHDDQ